MNFQQADQIIDREYISPIHQARVNNYLSTLRVNEFVEGGQEVSAALAKAYRTVMELSLQGPASHKGDAQEIPFLRCAVTGFNWSNETLSKVAMHEISFQRLYGELETALQMYKEAKEMLLRDKASPAIKSGTDVVAGMNGTGQRRYRTGSRTSRCCREGSIHSRYPGASTLMTVITC